MASNESFKQAIKAYLDKRAEEDSLFAPKYANEKKNIDECCSYIMGEARKRGNAVAISDEEVYGMAVHYYDEDDIKINRLPAGEKASVSSPSKPVELTEEDKKAARDRTIARLAEEHIFTHEAYRCKDELWYSHPCGHQCCLRQRHISQDYHRAPAINPPIRRH